ncbi:hypothetical protein HHL16_16725 [Pseudoflavitalea sp. G-6-1-2]|uniref:OmpP1/FadL family transporter n=1 Tax=Pseudoflavitalea sp. G-6-1-2 TaxID=2728841 RepID=UPI00146E1144|nr:hypothetical protein [Pseudoflavitalea sp. G-6-1-2]NML22529.1 hypothetical protein [Pseudoflavitalea sp. G-6-1-2]
MKKHAYTAIFLALSVPALAQVPEDALRMSWNPSFGTARQQAIGGAMGSLGGDISSIYVNPAGLGLYKTSEFVMTPGYGFYKTKGDFRGTNVNSDKLNKFQLGTTGFVIGMQNPYSKTTSSAFSIAVSRTANFNNNTYYRGLNDHSSYSEAFAEEFAGSGVAIDDVYKSSLSLGTKMAVYTYLIDTATIGGQKQVIGRPEYLDAVFQEQRTVTTGGVTEIAMGYAANLNNQLFIGGSVGIPILNYERKSTFTESDPTNNPDNNFNFSRYEQNTSVKGVGINVKLGLIYAPAPSFRVGAAIHTPTFYGLRDNLDAKMVTDLEKLFAPKPGIDSVNSDYYYNGASGQIKYNFTSPWRFMISGSYLFGSQQDVKKQKGFITADIEYVTYGSPKFKPAEEESDDYYKAVNEVTKNIYKGTFNFKVGGELKFNVVMARLGFAYYMNPYRDTELKANKMSLSGGLGYRHKGFFVDVTYVHQINKNVDFPYRLQDKANTFATLRERASNVWLTFGIKI